MLKSRLWLTLSVLLVGAFVWPGRSRFCTDCMTVRSCPTTAAPVVESCGIRPAEAAVAIAGLPARHSHAWGQPVAEPAFERFREWTEAWRSAVAGERLALVDGGVKLAAARRRAMADLIVADPQRALSLAVPRDVRDELPEQVAAFLE